MICFNHQSLMISMTFHKTKKIKCRTSQEQYCHLFITEFYIFCVKHENLAVLGQIKMKSLKLFLKAFLKTILKIDYLTEEKSSLLKNKNSDTMITLF